MHPTAIHIRNLLAFIMEYPFRARRVFTNTAALSVILLPASRDYHSARIVSKQNAASTVGHQPQTELSTDAVILFFAIASDRVLWGYQAFCWEVYQLKG